MNSRIRGARGDTLPRGDEPKPDEKPSDRRGRLAGSPAEGMTPAAGDSVSDNLRAALRKARGYS
jgi:hypothetical protein